MATIYQQIKSIGQTVARPGGTLQQNLRTLEAMHPGEAALWVARERESFCVPVRVEGDWDLDDARWHLRAFERIAKSAETVDGLDHFFLVECFDADGDGRIMDLTAVQARELLLQRVHRLEHPPPPA